MERMRGRLKGVLARPVCGRRGSFLELVSQFKQIFPDKIFIFACLVTVNYNFRCNIVL